jgi:hypothetical protein
MRIIYLTSIVITALLTFFLVMVFDLVTQLISSIVSVAVYSVLLLILKKMFPMNVVRVFALTNILLIGCAVMVTMVLMRTIF